MDNEKVYYPPEIVDNPLPSQSTQAMTSSQSSQSAEIASPSEITDAPLPIKIYAGETISETLNTKSKKILADFSFTQMGAIDVGQYSPGISGDVRISPNGIVARNSSGNNTFAIDGDTGDATFSGTIEAKDFIIADENGLVSASVFQSDSYYSNVQVQISNTFAFTTLSGSSLSLTLVRPAKVLITFFANVKLYATDALRGYHIDVAVAIDGVTKNEVARFEVSNMNSDLGACVSLAKTYLLSEGKHTLELRWAGFSDGTNEINARGLDYCMLGS